MITYHIPVSWTMAATIPVIAASLEDAFEAARQAPLPAGEYVSDSFRVDIALYDGSED